MGGYPQTVSFFGYNFELGGEVILLLLLGDRKKDIVLGGADVDGGDTAAVVHWTQN